MRILIAEDEISIAKALKVILEKQKYSVDVVYNGLDAVDYIKSTNYDALILDIMMPGIDGIETLQRIRNIGINTPAIFLTAKGEIEDRVNGLNAGADDYLSKPFATSELIARVRALIRRSDSYAPSVLSFGSTTLNCNQYMLSKNEKNIKLNNKEYQMMELFFRHPHQVFTSEHMMEKVWGLNSEADIDVVWTYIGFLRKKLKQINADVEIKTIRGAGYSLEEG